MPETADEAFLATASAVDRVHLWPIRHPLSERHVNEPGTALAVLARARLILGRPAVYREIASAIDARGFDVVFATHDQFTQAPDVLRHLSTPSVYYCHEPLRILHDDPDGAPRGLLGRLRRSVARPLLLRLLGSVDTRAARAADRVVVNSAYTAGAVRRAYGIESHVVHPAVDPAQFHPLGVAREDFVLSVGSLHPAKGHDFVVDALARIPALRRPRLVVVADRALGGFRPHFDALVARSGVAVEVATRVSEAELVGFYNRAIATVYAARREPFGLVPLESMACGTPVVAVAEGGVLETVRDGVNGRLVPRDAAALADAIEDVRRDPAGARARADAALVSVRECWTWAISCERLERELAAVARR